MCQLPSSLPQARVEHRSGPARFVAFPRLGWMPRMPRMPVMSSERLFFDGRHSDLQTFTREVLSKNDICPARQRPTPEPPASKKVNFFTNKNAPARQRPTPEPPALKKRRVWRIISRCVVDAVDLLFKIWSNLGEVLPTHTKSRREI